MEKQKFTKSLKIIVSILLITGISFIGFGVGLLTFKIIESVLISFGIGLLLTSLLLIIIEFDNY